MTPWFEWDSEKAWKNEIKHGIKFDDAMRVFEDPNAQFNQDRIDESGELRWQAVGLVGGLVVLLVAHTFRT